VRGGLGLWVLDRGYAGSRGKFAELYTSTFYRTRWIISAGGASS
jgi:hypothetical protein